MSTVLERARRISGQEWYAHAMRLKTEMTRYLFSAKNVPTKLRGICAYPLRDDFETLFRMMDEANNINIFVQIEGVKYVDSRLVDRRMALQYDCLKQLDVIYRHLQEVAELLWAPLLRQFPPTDRSERLRRTLNNFALALDRESELLQRWRASTARQAKKYAPLPLRAGPN